MRSRQLVLGAALAGLLLAGCESPCDPEFGRIEDGAFRLISSGGRAAGFPDRPSHRDVHLTYTREAGEVRITYRDDAGREVVETYRYKRRL